MLVVETQVSGYMSYCYMCMDAVHLAENPVFAINISAYNNTIIIRKLMRQLVVIDGIRFPQKAKIHRKVVCAF